jgi:predicted outer membrane repeat protein
MKIRKMFFAFALVVCAISLGGNAALFAQAADRAYYVDITGGKDDNNGRSVENAFQTLEKAFDAAKKTAVKKIVFAKSGSSYDSQAAVDTGDAEILVTSLDNTIAMRLSIDIEGKSKVRFENVRLIGGLGVRLSKGAQAIVGKDCEIYKILAIDNNTTLTIESNAKLIPTQPPPGTANETGINISRNAKVLIKDNVIITGYSGAGVGISDIGSELTIQDNVQISACKDLGMRIAGGKTILKGKVAISGNGNANYDNTGGIRISGGELTIQDDVSVTGNTTKTNGGGLYVTASKDRGTVENGYTHTTVLIKGNAVIANNTAKYGGGIYSTGSQENAFDPDDFWQMGWDGIRKQVTILRPGISVTVEGNASIRDNKATEGGGVYLAEGSVQSSYLADSAKGTATITQKPGGFVMTGGTISGNKADYGAGVYVASGEITIPEQRGTYDRRNYNYSVQNTGKQIAKPTFVFTGGSITANAAEFVGGGIYVKDKGAYVPGKGTATGNTAGDGEGENLYQLE